MVTFLPEYTLVPSTSAGNGWVTTSSASDSPTTVTFGKEPAASERTSAAKIATIGTEAKSAPVRSRACWNIQFIGRHLSDAALSVAAGGLRKIAGDLR